MLNCDFPTPTSPSVLCQGAPLVQVKHIFKILYVRIKIDLLQNVWKMIELLVRKALPVPSARSYYNLPLRFLSVWMNQSLQLGRKCLLLDEMCDALTTQSGVMGSLWVCYGAAHQGSMTGLGRRHRASSAHHLQPMEYAITPGHTPGHAILPLLWRCKF